MQYLVSFALLVAVGAWIVGVYNNLEHLRCMVCRGWAQWWRATHHRNACVGDFAAAFALLAPPENSLPRCLLRMVADSERTLAMVEVPRWGELHGFVGGAELLLRQAVAQAVQAVEESPDMRAHEQLQQLCLSVAVSLQQQEQLAALFNRAAREYNAALATPSARLLGPVFGFVAADPLDAAGAQNTRSSG